MHAASAGVDFEAHTVEVGRSDIPPSKDKPGGDFGRWFRWAGLRTICDDG